MGRKDAERLLLLPGNQRGTFLARESETTKGRTTGFGQSCFNIFNMETVMKALLVLVQGVDCGFIADSCYRTSALVMMEGKLQSL